MLSDVVELAAYSAFVIAGWLIAPALGLLVLGVALWLIAQALDGVKVRIPSVKLPKVRVKSPRRTSPRARPAGVRNP
jgi:hypothetical protein